MSVFTGLNEFGQALVSDLISYIVKLFSKHHNFRIRFCLFLFLQQILVKSLPINLQCLYSSLCWVDLDLKMPLDEKHPLDHISVHLLQWLSKMDFSEERQKPLSNSCNLNSFVKAYRCKCKDIFNVTQISILFCESNLLLFFPVIDEAFLHNNLDLFSCLNSLWLFSIKLHEAFKTIYA